MDTESSKPGVASQQATPADPEQQIVLPQAVDREWLESKFIEQEHRSVQVIANYFEHRKRSPDDPLRKAARRALLWRIFSPTTAAVAGGGFVAVATLIVLMYQTQVQLDQTKLLSEQNGFMREQNSSIQEQNKSIRDQIALAEGIDARQRRTDLLDASFDSSRALALRVQSLVEMLTTRQNDMSAKYSKCISDDGTNCSDFITVMDLSGIEFKGAAFALTDEHEWDRMNFSNSTFVDSEFSQGTHHEWVFDRANLTGTMFESLKIDGLYAGDAKFVNVVFDQAEIVESGMSGVDLSGAVFKSTKFTGVHVTNCNLTGAQVVVAPPGENIVNASFSGTVFKNCRGVSPEFKAKVEELGGRFE